VIYCDNQSCVKLLENPMFHDNLKHIEINYYFLRDKFQRGEVVLQYISTDEHTVDILTNHLSKINFAYLRDKLGIMDIAPLVERDEITSLVGRENSYVASWTVSELWICIMLVHPRDDAYIMLVQLIYDKYGWSC
jgi:hypothetical protein